MYFVHQLVWMLIVIYHNTKSFETILKPTSSKSWLCFSSNGDGPVRVIGFIKVFTIFRLGDRSSSKCRCSVFTHHNEIIFA